MKKILISLLLFCAVPAFSETVSAASFNPVRGTLGPNMGPQIIKASTAANLRGGLYTDILRTDAQTQVTMKNQTDPNRYQVGSVTDQRGNNQINMPNMIFRGAHTEPNPIPYQIDPSNLQAPLYPLERVLLKGGNTVFMEDSYVGSMKVAASNPRAELYLYANRFVSPKTFHITGNVSGSTVNTVNIIKSDLSNDLVTRGLRLSGIDIPYKTSAPNMNKSSCNMQWVQKVFSTGKYKVLGFVSCN